MERTKKWRIGIYRIFLKKTTATDSLEKSQAGMEGNLEVREEVKNVKNDAVFATTVHGMDSFLIY